MSQEKVREILSHVDMTKIDLSSFKMSEKKFNELATVYRNRLITSCVGILLDKKNWPEHDVEESYKILKEIVENPAKYEYSAVYSDARKLVDDMIDDMNLPRDKSVNDVKIKAIENCVKERYKSNRSSIEAALNVGIQFEQEFDEELISRCLKIAQKAIEADAQKSSAVEVEPHKEAAEEAEEIDTAEPNVDVCEHATNELQKETISIKVPFWKRLFAKG